MSYWVFKAGSYVRYKILSSDNYLASIKYQIGLQANESFQYRMLNGRSFIIINSFDVPISIEPISRQIIVHQQKKITKK